MTDHAADARGLDQPHRNAAPGTQPIRTIGREEVQAKLERGDDFKLVMATNRWGYDAKHIPGSLHFDTPDALYSAPTTTSLSTARRTIAARALLCTATSSPAATGTGGATRVDSWTGRTLVSRSRVPSSPYVVTGLAGA